MHLHILGICGTLMGSLALLARELGHEVTGTDLNVYPPMSTQLDEAGIDVNSPYTAENVPGSADLIIIGNAGLPRGNPAVESVLAGNIPYTSGAEWLARYLLHDRWVIAIAGTHGKTSTTAMVAFILEYAGLDPGFLIGGVPNNFDSSGRLGSEPFFVIEADEYDTSYFDRRSKFLHYRPRTLVLNNLEYDHADIFDDLDAIKNQFHLLLRSIPGNGLVIFPGNDEHLKDVLDMGCWTPTLQLGGKELAATPTRQGFVVSKDGAPQGEVAWEMTGNHNIANGLAALAAARHAGVPIGVGCEALCKFKGVKRRMELVFDAHDILVYDDFAHHPSAIRTTLAGLREKVGNDKILAVIEPASHTMRKGTHEESLATSVACADLTFWFHADNIAWNIGTLQTESSAVIAEIDELLDETIRFARAQRTHVVIMSNGSFSGFQQKLVQRLGTTSGPG